MADDGYDDDGNPIRPPLATLEAPYSGAKCRACRRSVIWAITVANSKRICLDAVPTLDGTGEILRSAFGDPVVRLHGGPPPEGHARYRVHLASCQPRTRGWRGRQQKGPT